MVVYIGGMSRSGSTLLDRLIGELPGVCSIGELVYTWERGILEGNRCGCGESFHQCPFWREVLAAAFGGMEQTDVRRVLELRRSVDRTRFIPWLLAPSLRPAFRRKLDEYLSYCTRVYEAVRAVSGCKVIVDSSKDASFAFCLRASTDLDLRFVHVVRDSRAVAHSWMRKVSREETTGPDHMPRLAPATTALRWDYQNGAFQLLGAVGTPTFKVHYEEFVSAPVQTLARVAQFAGIEVTPEQFGFIGVDESGHWAKLRAAHIASGNPMRFKTGRMRIRVDDGWKTSMSPGDRRTVTALTLPLLKRYGYLTTAVQS